MATSDQELSNGHHPGGIFKNFNEAERSRVAVSTRSLGYVATNYGASASSAGHKTTVPQILRHRSSRCDRSVTTVLPHERQTIPYLQGTLTFPIRPQIYRLRSVQARSAALQLLLAVPSNTGSLKRATSLSTSAKASGSSFWRFTRVRHVRHLG